MPSEMEVRIVDGVEDVVACSNASNIRCYFMCNGVVTFCVVYIILPMVVVFRCNGVETSCVECRNLRLEMVFVSGGIRLGCLSAQ